MGIKIYEKYKVKDENLQKQFENIVNSNHWEYRHKVKFSITKDVEKYLYYVLVWSHTEQNAKLLKDNHLRGKEYCLDHIIPISYGYENDIEPSIIGGLDNIRIIKHKENLTKGKSIKNITESNHIKNRISNYPRGSNISLGNDGNKSAK